MPEKETKKSDLLREAGVRIFPTKESADIYEIKRENSEETIGFFSEGQEIAEVNPEYTSSNDANFLLETFDDLGIRKYDWER